ncbi:hypothetical protein DRJ17_00565 [Candidatus Woesearchaeota archaeon]|nr:MAG: hypothetical protein DRJ17_00565 [Candidatus Woesearchaeota archaeon]
MIQGEIVEEKSMNVAEVKEELKKIKKRDKELGFRANKTEEYLQAACKIDQKRAKELYEKLENLKIPRFKDIHINKIIDILPKTIEDIQIMFQGYPITITQENIKKILDIVKEY